MTRRVLWLFFWTTMAFWSGCSTGGGPQAADEGTIDAYRTEVKGEAVADSVASDALPVASVTGLDRSHWKPMKVGPASGAVPHHPKYFETDTCTLVPYRPNPLAGDTVEAHAAAATSEATAPFDKRDWLQTPGLVGKSLFDIAAVPVRVIMDPPTSVHHTPSR